MTNNSAYKTNAKVIVLYKMKDENGEEVPVCGDIDYVLDIQPGETKNFEIHPLFWSFPIILRGKS